MSETTNATPRSRLSGRYDLLAQLGEGGMGVVHRAWDCNLSTEVVVKIPRAVGVDLRKLADRFAREVRSLVVLRHPHVVTILDVGEHGGVPFAVLQYLSGGSLKDRGARDFSGRHVPIAPASLRGWLPEIAAALDFVHSQGFVHRDVKPDNILFDGHGNVYLSDFGIAKVLASLAADPNAADLTGGGLIGTLAYMAPEQMMGQPCSGRADQYALAVTVYELLAGKGPFTGLTFHQVMARKTANEAQPLTAANPALPRAIAAVVHRGLAADPSARYPSCAAFSTALLKAVSEGTEPLPPPPPTRTLTPVPPAPPKLGPLPCLGCQNPIPLTPALFGKRVTCFRCKREQSVSADGRRLTPAGTIPPPVPAPAPAPPPRPAPQPRPTPPLPPDTFGGGPTPPTPIPPPKPPRRRAGTKLLLAAIVVLSATAAGLAVYRFWPRADLITRDDAVTGTIDIDYRTRHSPAPDADDVYTVDLAVRAEPDVNVLYRGTILRRPPVKGTPASPGWLKFNLTLTERRGPPGAAKERTLGKITGVVPQSTDGLYAFDELKWTDELGVTVGFGGKVQGKLGGERAKTSTEVPVFVGGERMTYLVADSDPMKFRGLVIPADNGLGIPAVELGGELTFDYDKGSYLPNDLTFTSGRTADRAAGIIDWHKTPAEYVQDFKVGDTATNARSQYRFNLVFLPGSASASGGARVGKGDEAKLTLTDKKLATLNGAIDYADEGPVRKEPNDPEPSVLPHKSRLTFRLGANRLTGRQLHTFLKVWLLMSGPVNDE